MGQSPEAQVKQASPIIQWNKEKLKKRKRKNRERVQIRMMTLSLKKLTTLQAQLDPQKNKDLNLDRILKNQNTIDVFITMNLKK